jgi:hypothetical protein
MKRRIRATGAASAEEALRYLLGTQEEPDRWLLEDRDPINPKIRLGMEQFDHGEGITEDRLDDYPDELKARPE